MNYIDLFDRAARSAGDRPALIDDNGSLSFSEVTSRSNRIANALIAQGLPPSFRFALLSPNTSSAMVAMLGALSTPIHKYTHDAPVNIHLAPDGVAFQGSTGAPPANPRSRNAAKLFSPGTRLAS